MLPATALDYLQPTTVLPGLALVLLAYNIVKPIAARTYARLTSASRSQLRQNIEVGGEVGWVAVSLGVHTFLLWITCIVS